VKAQLKILTGARAGYIEVFSKPYVSIGRHPASDLKFDPQHDLDVSARHAAVMKQGEHWYVRDLDSRNGTLVNGHRITRDVRLDDTDQIRFGAEGPVMEVRLVPEGTPDGVAARATRPQPSPVAAAVSSGERRVSTTERIRVEVVRQTRKLRTVFIGVTITVVAVAAVFLYQTWRQEQELERELERELAALQARTDSILRAADEAVRALEGQVEGLATALQSSHEAVTNLQSRLATAQQAGSSEDVEALRRQLADATQALYYQEIAAHVDYGSIVDGNQGAVALVWVEFAEGEVHTATAFAVRSDGILVTNRHVVAGEDGTRRPRRIAVRFADSEQTWRGSVLAVAPDADLALLKVDIRSGVPTVYGLNARPDTLDRGDPLALIGFPLGTDLPMTGGHARTSFWAGSVSKTLEDLIQVDGYGARGASGSPVFDRGGEVVAVVYGGEPESAGRIVYAVPSSAVLRLLDVFSR
jgi:S1-C subfamily serine protease